MTKHSSFVKKKKSLKKPQMRDIARLMWSLIRFGILLGLCFMIIYPYIVKILNTFKSYPDYLDPTVRYIPKYFTLDNLTTILEQMNYKKTLITTVLYSSLIALIEVIVSALAGYGLARIKFKGNKLLFVLVIFELLVPPQTVFMPMYIKFRFFYGGLNLINTYWPGIILALTGLGIKNGLFIFMFRQFFKNMPKELEEAAYVDGCSVFKTFFRVMLPNAVTLMVTVFLFAFAWQWTDTTNTTLYMRNTELMANAVNNVNGGELSSLVVAYNNSGAMLAVLPIALVYLVGQKFFIQSVERSGITG